MENRRSNNSVYVKIREGQSAWQSQLTGDASVIADYGRDDLLIGIEFLSPIDVTIDGESVIKPIVPDHLIGGPTQCPKCSGRKFDRWPVENPLFYCFDCRSTVRNHGGEATLDVEPVPEGGGWYVPVGVSKGFK